MQFSHALPEALRDVRAVEVLERSLASGRLAHGILLHGDDLSDLEAIAQAATAHLLPIEGQSGSYTCIAREFKPAKSFRSTAVLPERHVKFVDGART